QKQENAHTVQAELEKQIQRVTGETVNVCSAGRTDAGVHARGQVIAFDTAATIPAVRWTPAINTFLPPDIRVLNSAEASPDFHPQFQAVSKRYSYYLYREKKGAVFYRNHALCIVEPLHLEAMREACCFIIGRHNFLAFCARGSSAKTFERMVLDCCLTTEGPLLRLDIEADGFLYNMVRIVMGTLLQVGRGKIAATGVADIIQSRDRTQAGPTVPPQGLYLVSVTYPSDSV
ncbi:MAG: tRNA pseudouridine(38-40) synthase TruA, partial [Syntrophomonadaceae bacterium]